MTAEQVKEVVKFTLDELACRRLLQNYYQWVLKALNKRLYDFFNGAPDDELEEIIECMSCDKYIEVLYYLYRDRQTVEWIADKMKKDTSTIKRNKKRLIMSIYEALED